MPANLVDKYYYDRSDVGQNSTLTTQLSQQRQEKRGRSYEVHRLGDGYCGFSRCVRVDWGVVPRKQAHSLNKYSSPLDSV